MIRKASYHTHSTFSDGKDDPETVVESACKKGFTAIGFSDHALYPYAMDWHIAPRNVPLYIPALRALEQKLRAENCPVAVFAGFEADYMPLLSPPDFSPYLAYAPDYIIGSVHYISPLDRIPAGTVPVCADSTAAEITVALHTVFDGSIQKMVHTYWQNQRDMIAGSPLDILGHMDLIKIRNAASGMFCEDDRWYQDEVAATIEAAARKKIIVEINTGGIGRGSIKEIYPSPWILKWLCQAGVPVTINSDSHSAETLDCAYRYAAECAAAAGYTTLMHLDREQDGSCSWNAYPF